MTRIMSLLAAGLFACGVVGCDVDQTREGELPDVDVDVQGGQMPAFDVETADVDVGTTEATVTVPDVDVHMPDEN